MHKIILRIGLLVFALAVFYYSQSGYALKDILIRSFFLFTASTVILGVAALVTIRTIKKGSDNGSEKI